MKRFLLIALAVFLISDAIVHAASGFTPPRDAESLGIGLAKQYATRALNSISHPLDDQLLHGSVTCRGLPHSDTCQGTLTGPDPYTATIALYQQNRAIYVSIRLHTTR